MREVTDRGANAPLSSFSQQYYYWNTSYFDTDREDRPRAPHFRSYVQQLAERPFTYMNPTVVSNGVPAPVHPRYTTQVSN